MAVMRMRKAKCAECKQSFRTAEAGRKVCQNCDGSHDNSTEVAKEAELIRKANSTPKKAPQSVDPRTGLPPEPGKPTTPTASSPAKKGKKPDA